MTDYSKDIIQILLRVPDGLSIRKIVRHVYNSHNTFFETVPLDDVKRSVTQYLTSRANSKSSPIEHAAERGCYRLKPNMRQNLQLTLDFNNDDDNNITDGSADNNQSEGIKSSADDNLPDMFEGMY